VAEGLIDVAVARGLDPRDFSLMAFGAAGPLMLPAVLDHVRARRVIVPPFPGLFSALGLLSADRVYSDSQSAYLVLGAEAAPAIAATFDRIETALRAQLPPGEEVTVRRTFDGRLVGQSWDTPFVAVPDGPIDASAVAAMVAAFHDEYEARYGNRFEAMPVESVTYRVELITASPKVSYPPLPTAEGGRALAPDRMVTLGYLDPVERYAGEYERERLRSGDVITGPAIVREPTSTTHILAGQQLTVGGYGELIVERAP
jgi:N-methylhydantoinase A